MYGCLRHFLAMGGVAPRLIITDECASMKAAIDHILPKTDHRDAFFDDEGNLLEDVPADPMEVAIRKKNSEARNRFEDLIQKAKHSNEGLDFLSSSLSNLETTFSRRWFLVLALVNKMNMNLSLVQKFLMKLSYTHLMISRQRGDTKESRKTRR
jgi:hypothetical protein